MDCSLPGSSVHGILQARTLELVAISFSRGSFRPKNWTCSWAWTLQADCYTLLIFMLEMKLQLTALFNSLIHPHLSFYLPGLSPEPPWGSYEQVTPHFSASLKEWILGWVFLYLGSICYHPAICFQPSKKLLNSLICWWTLFCLSFCLLSSVYTFFSPLANVHHLNWKFPHKLYIDLSWVNKTTLQASQDFTSPIISRRRITKFLNNLKQSLETLAKMPSLDFFF